MSTRNPMNERYQGDGPSGKTRKSASSAKPKHKAAESVRIEGRTENKPKGGGLFAGAAAAQSKSSQSKSQKERERAERRAAEHERQLRMSEIEVEGDDRYRLGRKLWWAMLACAVVATALSFFINSQSPQNPVPGIVSIAFAYVFLIGAVIVDFKMVRPIRKKKEQLASVPLSKSQQKALEADRLRRAQEAAAAREERNKKFPYSLFAGLTAGRNKKQVDKVAAELEAAQAEADEAVPGKDEADEIK